MSWVAEVRLAPSLREKYPLENTKGRTVAAIFTVVANWRIESGEVVLLDV